MQNFKIPDPARAAVTTSTTPATLAATTTPTTLGYSTRAGARQLEPEPAEPGLEHVAQDGGDLLVPRRRELRLIGCLAAVAMIAAAVIWMVDGKDDEPGAWSIRRLSHASGGGDTSRPQDDGDRVPEATERGGADPRPPMACDLTRRSFADYCPVIDCGSNGPYLSGFLVDGLNFDGCRNHDGVRVVPGSIRPGGRCRGATRLDLVDGALVGRDAAGAIVCRAGEIDGTRFTVDGPPRALGLPAGPAIGARELRIGLAEQVPVLTVPGAPGGTAALPAYTFEPVGATRTPTCSPGAAWIDDFTEPRETSEPAAASSITPALLVAGELYDSRNAQVLLQGKGAGRWLNVACRGSALAKLRQLGFDPAQPSSTPDERQATLKMITARYCDADSYTTAGVALLWHYYKNPVGASPERFPQVGPVEAKWGPQGAICVSHSRAWRKDQPPPVFSGLQRFSSEQDLIDHVRRTCDRGPAWFAGGPLPPCGGGPGEAEAYWTTYTVDHLAH